MDWYVDNGMANDTNNGHSKANAKKSVNGVNVAADFTAILAPHHIYIKATGVEYTGATNLITWKSSVPNITIDRYDTDTGVSRPIFSRGATATNGSVWQLNNNDDCTIRNIHFKGKSVAGTDSDARGFGIINAAGAVMDNLIVEYCIIEQLHSYTTIYSMNGSYTNLTVRYCHIYRDITIQDDYATYSGYPIKGAILAGSNGIASANISYNVFENYVLVGNFYHTSGGKTYSVDHNTFVNCGRTSNGKILNFSTIYHISGGGDTVVVCNNICVGNSSVGSIGVYATGEATSTYTANHNDWYQIETPYGGATISPTGDGDIALDPEWQGGAQTWSETYIALTYYYAPANTNYPVVRGDSISSCMGAIFVTPYIPPNPEPETPTPVTISTPSIPGLGVLPCYGNALFNRLKSHLVDDNIYDTSDAAIGITNYNVTFTGNIGDMAVSSLTIYRNYGNEVKVVSVVIPDASGNYSFNDKLPHGRASYYGKSSDGKYFSNTIHIHSYYIHVWLCAYATEFLTLKQQTAQVRQNAKIADGTDFDGNIIATDGYYLAKNFGQYITARKLEDMTRAEYQQLLLNVLEAYNLGPSVEAIDLICEVFTGQLPSLLWYKDIHGFPTTSVRLRVASAPSLSYEWDATSVYLYDRHYTIPAGTGSIGSGLTEYIYVDGTVSPTTVDDRLSVLATGVMPFRYVMNRSYTVPSTLVRVDLDGSNTGVSGELYVTLDRFPVSFVGASGTLAPFVSGIPGAFLVPQTSDVDLNIAQGVIPKSMLLGDVTVDYTTDYENMILGIIHAGASAITGITYCGRPDGNGAVSRDIQVHECCGELRIRGSASLSDDARLDLFNTLHDVKFATSFFYVFFENPISGVFEYYGTI